MANSYSTQDIVKGVLQKSGENTDGTSQYHELALKYVNNAYHEILSGANEFIGVNGHSWRWARSRASFVLKGFISSGSVSLTLSSTSGTFSVAPTVSVAGYYVKINDEPTYYEVDTHTASSTAFVLKTAYLGTTGAGKGFKAIPLRYDLVSASGLSRGILRLLNPLRIYENRDLEFLETGHDLGRLYGIDIDIFTRDWPLRDLENAVPSRFCTDYRTESSWIIQINKFPTNPMQVDYDYVQIQDDLVDASDNLPVLPREFRNCLECCAAHYLLTDKENKEKAAYYFQIAKAKLMALHDADMKNDLLTSNAFGKLVPRQDETGIPWWLIGR